MGLAFWSGFGILRALNMHCVCTSVLAAISTVVFPVLRDLEHKSLLFICLSGLVIQDH